MSITLDAHATFIADGSFRKDTYEEDMKWATRICLTFIIKAVPERTRKREQDKK